MSERSPGEADGIVVPRTPQQLVRYAAVGVGVLGFDWLLFVVLMSAGLPIPAANVLGRLGGALLGFLINGRHTFPAGQLPTHVQLVRFWIMWVLLTTLSTLLVSQLPLTTAWLGKPLIDVGLALLGFLASKYWVYR